MVVLGTARTLLARMVGESALQMSVWRMTETPPRVRWACRPPGYHNGYVYQKYLGWGPSHLAALRARGIV